MSKSLCLKGQLKQSEMRRVRKSTLHPSPAHSKNRLDQTKIRPEKGNPFCLWAVHNQFPVKQCKYRTPFVVYALSEAIKCSVCRSPTFEEAMIIIIPSTLIMLMTVSDIWCGLTAMLLLTCPSLGLIVVLRILNSKDIPGK